MKYLQLKLRVGWKFSERGSWNKDVPDGFFTKRE